MASVHKTKLPLTKAERAAGKTDVDARTSWIVRYRDPATGKHAGKRFRTKSLADKFARSIQTDIDRGAYVDPSLGKITVAAMCEHYMSVAGIAPSTRAGYELWIRKYIVPRIGAKRLGNVTKADVRVLYASLTADGVGGATVRHVAQLLHAVLDMAVDEDRIQKNPAHGIDLPDVQVREAFALTAAQVELLANEVGPRHKAFVKLIAYAGLRPGEAASLKVRNVDLMHKTIRVVDGGTGQTKTRKMRVVSFPTLLVDDLATHIAAWSDPKDPDAFVFANDHGDKMNVPNFRNRVLYPAARRAGVLRDGKPPRVHDLRHSAASLLASAGFSLHEVSRMLGHSSVGITGDLYTHLFPSELDKKADRFNAMLEEASSGVPATPATVTSIT